MKWLVLCVFVDFVISNWHVTTTVLNKKVLFTDGLCHIMWFSIGHCIKTKNYSTKNDKVLK